MFKFMVNYVTAEGEIDLDNLDPVKKEFIENELDFWEVGDFFANLKLEKRMP